MYGQRAWAISIKRHDCYAPHFKPFALLLIDPETCRSVDRPVAGTAKCSPAPIRPASPTRCRVNADPTQRCVARTAASTATAQTMPRLQPASTSDGQWTRR